MNWPEGKWPHSAKDKILDKDGGMIFMVKRYSHGYGECLLLD